MKNKIILGVIFIAFGIITSVISLELGDTKAEAYNYPNFVDWKFIDFDESELEYNYSTCTVGLFEIQYQYPKKIDLGVTLPLRFRFEYKGYPKNEYVHLQYLDIFNDSDVMGYSDLVVQNNISDGNSLVSVNNENYSNNYIQYEINQDTHNDFGEVDTLIFKKATFSFLESSTFVINDMCKAEYTVGWLDVTPPQIVGEGVYYSDVENPIEVSTITSGISANDVVSGDVTDSIEIVLDTYSINKTVVGEYQVKYKACDDLSNCSYFLVKVRVVDINKPIIEFNNNYNNVSDYYVGNATFIFGYKNIITLEEIKNHYKVIDYSETTVEVYSSVGFINRDETDLGEYEITIKATDVSENYSYKKVALRVIDDVAPTINGVNEVLAPMSNGIKSLAYIKSLLTATDEIDGTLTNDIKLISDTYSSNAMRPGKYKIVFEVSDTSKNTSTKEILIEVIDNVAPTIVVDSNIIPTDEANLLTQEQIVNLIKNVLNQKGTNYKTITLIEDNYSSNRDKAGTYKVSFSVLKSDNSTEIEEMTLRVFSGEELLIENLNFIQKQYRNIIQNFNKNRDTFVFVGIVSLVLVAGVVVIKIKRA